jgi:hypothetical protein
MRQKQVAQAQRLRFDPHQNPLLFRRWFFVARAP